jgi:glycosyltransferase involved in cell wall biosynthesis
MTVSEAGACATPAVVSRIAGHVDSVEHDVGGLVVDIDLVSHPGQDRRAPGSPGAPGALADAVRTVLGDEALRTRLGRGAQAHAQGMSWEATAAGTLETLVEEALARR